MVKRVQCVFVVVGRERERESKLYGYRIVVGRERVNYVREITNLMS